MVLTARPVSLFSSRVAPALLRRAAALHTRALPPPGPALLGSSRAATAAFRGSSRLSLGPLVSTRLLTTRREKVKVLAVLYDGGVHAEQVPGLLGTTENELGIRKWLEDQGHTLVTTSDKEGENSTFDKELVDAEIIITTP